MPACASLAVGFGEVVEVVVEEDKHHLSQCKGEKHISSKAKKRGEMPAP